MELPTLARERRTEALRILILDEREADLWEGRCNQMEEKRPFFGDKPLALRNNIFNFFCFCLAEES